MSNGNVVPLTPAIGAHMGPHCVLALSELGTVEAVYGPFERWRDANEWAIKVCPNNLSLLRIMPLKEGR